MATCAVAPERPRPWRIAGHILFVAIAVGLGFHVLPGFDNPRVVGPVRYTADAVPFTMYLNLDKPLAGYWLLLVWPALCLHQGRWSWTRGALIGLLTAAVSLGLAVVFGLVSFAPKWPTLTWLWALNNLLIVCVTEEAAFRGYLQEGLARRFALQNPPIVIYMTATAFLVMVCYVLIAVQVVLTLVQSYILLSAGIFFLAFGAFRSTASLAENYLLACVHVGIKLMILYFVVGLGEPLTRTWAALLRNDRFFTTDIGPILEVFAGVAILAFIVWYIPNKIAGQITGGASLGLAAAMRSNS